MPPAPPSVRKLAQAHKRFARAVFWLYGAAAACALGLVGFEIVQERNHEQQGAREDVLREARQRADDLSAQSSRLARELQRLAARAEVDLSDQDSASEQRLLMLAHERSSVFTRGVAIVDRDGRVLLSEPSGFLPAGTDVATESWFSRALKSDPVVAIVAIAGGLGRELRVAVPAIRGPATVGVFVGAVDLAAVPALSLTQAAAKWRAIVLRTAGGSLVYTARSPALSEEDCRRLIDGVPSSRGVVQRVAWGSDTFAVAPVALPHTDLELLGIADEAQLLDEPRHRARTRLALAVVLALAPFAVLTALLAGSLRMFRRVEEGAQREERLRLIGEASSQIAHEVKNGLNGLRIGIDMLLREDPGGGATGAGTSASKARVAAELRKQIERMSEFSSELLLFAKGGIKPRTTPLDLCEFIPKVGEILRVGAREAGVQLRIDVGEGPIAVSADPALLHIVLANLLGNAVEAVSIQASPEDARVDVTVTATPRFAQVRVSDNGPGIPPGLALFEPFASAKPSGVGIGLALSRRIAQAHGGDLVLEPTPAGSGASFLLTLPREAS